MSESYNVWTEFVGSIKNRKKFAVAVVIEKGENKAVMRDVLDSANDVPFEQSWRAVDWIFSKLEAKKCPVNVFTMDYELANAVEAAKEDSVVGAGPLQKFYDRMKAHPEFTVTYAKTTEDFDRYIKAHGACTEALQLAGIR